MNKPVERWLSANAALVSGLCLLTLGIVALTIINVQQPRQISRSNAQQTIITPSFYPLAPCPSCASPSQPLVSISLAPPSSIVTPSTSAPSPSLDPCEPTNSAIAHDRKNSKHKKHKGAISEFIQQLLELLMELINKLMELLGGGQIKQPQTPESPTVPSDTPDTEDPDDSDFPGITQQPDGVSPTMNPCPPENTVNPTNVPQPSTTTPSHAVPSVVPSSGAPSSSPAPSGQPSPLTLTIWKLQLPTGSQGKVDEVKQPELATYTKDPWYVPNANEGIRFRAAVNGVTTSGSSYPRSELREMNGTAQAAWSPASGTHTMTIEQAITAVPKTKKHVVAGQIHDAANDVIVVRLELPKLMIKIGDTVGPILDQNYTLGKKFKVKFEATGGKTNIYYNGAAIPAYTLNTSYSNAYFKAGAYTQSNCTTEASSDCNENNYGEVVIYKLDVTHN